MSFAQDWHGTERYGVAVEQQEIPFSFTFHVSTAKLQIMRIVIGVQGV